MVLEEMTQMMSLVESLKECECGCKELIPTIRTDGKPSRFKNGHNCRGKKDSIETRKKKSLSMKGKNKGKNTGEKHHRWKGDSIGMDPLHRYVKRYLPATPLCEICNMVPPKHLANVTGVYNRDLSNWKWFCIKCHWHFDNHNRRRDPVTGRLMCL